MFNKKGDHVDWAISMGIFLIYLVGLFILLRPGVTPVYKPEGLLQILENKFEEKVMWEVREIPLIVELCKTYSEGAKTGPSEIMVEDKNDGFKFSKVICEGKDCLGKDKYSGGNRFVVKCGGSEEQPALGDVIFTLTYYPQKDKLNAIPKLTEKDELCKPNNKEYCEAYLGASTSKKGVNGDLLDDLKKLEYSDELKKEWGIPIDKEFAIFSGDSEENLELKIGPRDGTGKFKEPQGVNLFIKQFKTQRVDPNGGITIPIIVNIRVW